MNQQRYDYRRSDFIGSVVKGMTRMQRFTAFLVLVSAASLALTGVVHAAPVYKYVFGGDVYRVIPGGTVNVPVFLQETVATGDVSVLAPGGVGLFGAGVKVVFGDPPQPSDPARVCSASDILASSAFDVVTPAVELTNAKLELFSFDNPAVHGQEYSLGVYRLELGIFRFTAGSVADQSTPIRATDYDSLFDDVITSDGRPLDSSPISDGSAMIITVPEAGTLAMLAVAVATTAVIGIARRRSPRASW
jgi:hypothetical protein